MHGKIDQIICRATHDLISGLNRHKIRCKLAYKRILAQCIIILDMSLRKTRAKEWPLGMDKNKTGDCGTIKICLQLQA